MVPAPASERWAEAYASEHWKPSAVRLAVHPGAGKTQTSGHRSGSVPWSTASRGVGR